MPARARSYHRRRRYLLRRRHTCRNWRAQCSGRRPFGSSAARRRSPAWLRNNAQLREMLIASSTCTCREYPAPAVQAAAGGQLSGGGDRVRNAGMGAGGPTSAAAGVARTRPVIAGAAASAAAGAALVAASSAAGQDSALGEIAGDALASVLDGGLADPRLQRRPQRPGGVESNMPLTVPGKSPTRAPFDRLSSPWPHGVFCSTVRAVSARFCRPCSGTPQARMRLQEIIDRVSHRVGRGEVILAQAFPTAWPQRQRARVQGARRRPERRA